MMKIDSIQTLLAKQFKKNEHNWCTLIQFRHHFDNTEPAIKCLIICLTTQSYYQLQSLADI